MPHTVQEMDAMRQQAQAMVDRVVESHQALLAAVRSLGLNTDEVEAYWRSVGPLSAEDEAGLSRAVLSIAALGGGPQAADGTGPVLPSPPAAAAGRSAQPQGTPASRVLRERMASRI